MREKREQKEQKEQKVQKVLDRKLREFDQVSPSIPALPGRLAEELKIPPNTLSFHLAHMTKAGLVRSKRSGRSITYYAETALVPQLISFLQANCCVRESESKPKTKRKACR